MERSTIQVRVSRKKLEAQDICSFELIGADGGVLPPFSAGSHVDVQTPAGLTRQYSLCNDPATQGRYQIAVLNDPKSRGGSRAMHELVREGDVLSISDPRNHFTLVNGAARSILVAGGIGVTPLLCMAERLANVGSFFDMHYCTRTEAKTAFLHRIRESRLAPYVHFHFDDGPPSQLVDMQRLLSEPATHTHLYVCGPSAFMDYVIHTALESGWNDSHIHREYFGSPPASASADVAFEVQLASSGQVVRVASDQTIVQALAAAGLTVSTSCEQGVCGTCLTGCLEGIPDHRDLYLTADERAKNDQLLLCCSRSKATRLVLDL